MSNLKCCNIFSATSRENNAHLSCADCSMYMVSRESRNCGGKIVDLGIGVRNVGKLSQLNICTWGEQFGVAGSVIAAKTKTEPL